MCGAGGPHMCGPQGRPHAAAPPPAHAPGATHPSSPRRPRWIERRAQGSAARGDGALPPPLSHRLCRRCEAGQLELDAGAARGGGRRLHRAPVRVGDRLHDREAEARAAGGAVACGIGAVEALEDRARADRRGCPGRRPGRRSAPARGPRARRAGARARRAARCARSRCARGCAAPARAGRGRRAACPPAPARVRSGARRRAPRTRPTAPRRSRSSVDLLEAQELRLLAAGEQQQVVDEARDARDLGRARAARRAAPPRARGRFCAASTSSCPRITVSGVRSSCEASATNARWPANAIARRSSMWLKASASTRTSRAPRSRLVRSAGRGRPRRHARRRAAIRRSGLETRVPISRAASSAAASARAPARMNARATPSCARETVASEAADADRGRQRTLGDLEPDGAAQHAHVPDVRHLQRGVAVRRAQQLSREASSRAPAARRSRRRRAAIARAAPASW